MIVNISLRRGDADEIRGYIGKKEGHKAVEEKGNNKLGDADTFERIEAASQLVVCYQLGRRDIKTAVKFTDKLQPAPVRSVLACDEWTKRLWRGGRTRVRR